MNVLARHAELYPVGNDEPPLQERNFPGIHCAKRYF